MTKLTPRPIPAAWIPALDAFAEALRAGGASTQTQATRMQHLRHVARALGGSPWTVDGAQLVGWCGRQDWAVETRRARRATFRAFWSWAHAAGHVAVDPSAELPSVKAALPTPRPAPEISYREALLRARPRERVILRLAAEAGLRRAEVARVHSRDLVDDLDGASLVVTGKGGKQRVVPLTATLAAELRARPRGYAFPGADDGHLSPRWVGKIVAELLPGTATMHQLRHRFATRAYAVDRDVLTVQQLLGHASPATTQRYVVVPPEAGRRTVLAAAG